MNCFEFLWNWIDHFFVLAPSLGITLVMLLFSWSPPSHYLPTYSFLLLFNTCLFLINWILFVNNLRIEIKKNKMEGKRIKSVLSPSSYHCAFLSDFSPRLTPMVWTLVVFVWVERNFECPIKIDYSPWPT